jgi:hypothetical protein
LRQIAAFWLLAALARDQQWKQLVSLVSNHIPPNLTETTRLH